MSPQTDAFGRCEHGERPGDCIVKNCYCTPVLVKKVKQPRTVKAAPKLDDIYIALQLAKSALLARLEFEQDTSNFQTLMQALKMEAMALEAITKVIP